jgi:hypothetical protein
MARYKKIDVRIWNDAKFNALSSDAQLIFLYLLTSPQTTMLGAVPVDKHTVSRILKFDDIRYGIGYKQLSEYGMLEYDEAGIFWIKNFLKYNPPENPKVVISWSSLLDLFPECQLLIKIAKSVLKACETRGEAYVKALHPEFKKLAKYDIAKGMSYGIAYGMPYQEQEQEQEQETYTRTENNEKQSELAENFAGRECEKPVSLKTEAIEEELPLEEREASVSKKEIVESKPKKEVKTQRLQKPEELTDEFWQDFFTYRKQKKAPVTERVISLLRKEAKKAGWTLEEVINEMMVRNWTGFKADWVKDDWKDPNAHWVSAAEYNKELPPVTYSTGAKTKFVERLHAGMRAYDIKDLPNNKEQR